jgi:hypothetical protein
MNNFQHIGKMLAQSLFINVVLHRLSAINARSAPSTPEQPDGGAEGQLPSVAGEITGDVQTAAAATGHPNPQTWYKTLYKNFPIYHFDMTISIKELCLKIDHSDALLDIPEQDGLNVCQFFQSKIPVFVLLMVRTWLDHEEKRNLQFHEMQRMINLLFDPPPPMQKNEHLLSMTRQMLQFVSEAKQAP